MGLAGDHVGPALDASRHSFYARPVLLEATPLAHFRLEVSVAVPQRHEVLRTRDQERVVVPVARQPARSVLRVIAGRPSVHADPERPVAQTGVVADPESWAEAATPWRGDDRHLH